MERCVEKEVRPEKLFRAITIHPSKLSIDKFREILVPGSINEDDSTKISDGNELGVYMSTNPTMVEYAYAKGGGGIEGLNIKVPSYDSGRGTMNQIQLPSCGIIFEISTKDLDIRKPEITPDLQGVYNNGFEGDEWIADNISPSHYRVVRLSLSRYANDREVISVKVEGDSEESLQQAINFIKQEFEKKKQEAEKFKIFLESLSDRERLVPSMMLERKWKKFKKEN